MAEESRKICGARWGEVLQVPTAAPRGWLDGSMFGTFLDALR